MQKTTGRIIVLTVFNGTSFFLKCALFPRCRWHWTSFLAASSTSIYVYMYSFYYFFFKTKMYGLFQTTFYFGYMALFSGALGIICGTTGYLGTSLFVRKIYSNVKID